MAQSVEHLFVVQKVAGSSPASNHLLFFIVVQPYFYIVFLVLHPSHPGIFNLFLSVNGNLLSAELCPYFCYFFLLASLFTVYICVISKNILNVLLSFCLFVFFMSGVFFSLGAEFLPVVFPLVYVGGILVLFLFSIMLLNFRDASFES